MVADEVPAADKEAPAADREVPVVDKEVLVANKEEPVADKEEPLADKEVLVADKELPEAFEAASPAFLVNANETPVIESRSEVFEFAVTVVEATDEPAVESVSSDVIVVPTLIEPVQPILADTQSEFEAPSTVTAGLATQALTTPDRPNVATIASEIVIPATEPFPAGTTLAEVYADHVQRSEQLPAALQTLGPKGALPLPAVASTSSVRRSDPQVQRNRTPNRANEQIERSTEAEPLVTAVASAAKLHSIPVDPPELDYDSMARPATSGDGTYDYFMDLPSDDFAIQLKAEKSLPLIRSFATAVDLEDPLVLKTQLMKRPLYVLVLDTFNDIQLASDAKRAWMARYDNGIEPWIRTVGSLQKTMQPIGPMD